MNRDAAARRLLILTAGIFLLSGCLIDQIGGAFTKSPEEFERNGSTDAKKLVDEAFEGIDPARLVDFHTHIIAIGTTVADAFVNPQMRSGINLERLKFLIYASASAVRNIDDADRQYVDRLIRLARGSARHGKFRILAFDKHYNTDGSVNRAKTNMYIPNHYVVELARQHPDIFLPVISVHPYRRDAIEELEKWAQAGVKYVKWLPNAMGMDPAGKSVEPFYRKMKEYGMILLSHGGEEQAVEAAEDQELGNPLRLRKPLDMGVRVIVAHSASLGTCDDLDSVNGKKTDCFDLFLRLMDEAKYRGLVFGEISAMLQFNRMPGPVLTLLKRQDLHSRLVNGSDYPLPAINALIRTRSLASDGFITGEERSALNEIYDYNPLLFDFVLKRTLRHPETKQKFAPSVFMENPGLE
ncbi:MAG TPA: amidohydrolase family protein [Candidatus Binatus sp.]|nr:amidohydrolase family protein [Candidatus Binatus sp.]